MICNKIRLENYRNVKRAEVELDPGVNFFFGENAQGKTNMLEAVYLFARGRSFRTVHDAEIITHGEDYSRAEIIFTDKNRKQDFEIFFNTEGKRRCVKNGVPSGKISELIGDFRAVLFCPQTLEIIKGGPSERRTFLDVAISQIKPVYLLSLQKYRTVLNQRNALLKSGGSEEGFSELMEVFASQLSKEAQTISRERAEYAEKLNLWLSGYFKDMTGGKEKPEIKYVKERGEEDFFRLFTENIQKEIMYGTSLYGPHKDDFSVILNGFGAREYASQGQQRSIALALKLSEGEISKETGGEYPVFLFDDILSELDGKRKDYLLKNLGERQIIITSCEDSMAKVTKFFVTGGTYVKEKE